MTMKIFASHAWGILARIGAALEGVALDAP
jgi:hypothetical protein